ncbi:hypothetical protein [Megasphaera massiliensis]|uniref:hypothetical protein n=1 Tax=Megasphaera massiliensis TaxID=1232428 RepID=UPI00266DC6D0|nr:hypothetical protein [Megasphaera massiliensis]
MTIGSAANDWDPKDRLNPAKTKAVKAVLLIPRLPLPLLLVRLLAISDTTT